MNLEELLASPNRWLHGSGPHGAIVVSSRIRLARNLRQRPFPGWAKKTERLQILAELREPVEAIPAMQNGFSAGLQDLTPVQKTILVERHLVSREQAQKGVGSAVVISRDQSLSIMINEEDHLRMQSLLPGLQLRQAYDLNLGADTFLEDRLDFAFHPELGYLTACPTNVGTGLRASAMVHLPGLVLTEQINQIINSVNKIGLAVRGLHGEGTEAIGNLFQVSNQTTLGEAEIDLITRLERVVEQIIGHEQNARQALAQRRTVMLLDQVGRAYGVLSHAHSIASKEALNLLSILKLATDLGIFPESTRPVVDELFMTTQPAHLQVSVTQDKLSAEERDTLRARLIRARLGSIPGPDLSRVDTPPSPQRETQKDE